MDKRTKLSLKIKKSIKCSDSKNCDQDGNETVVINKPENIDDDNSFILQNETPECHQEKQNLKRSSDMPLKPSLRLENWTPLPSLDLLFKKAAIRPALKESSKHDIDREGENVSRVWVPLPKPCFKCLCKKRQNKEKNRSNDEEKKEPETSCTINESFSVDNMMYENSACENTIRAENSKFAKTPDTVLEINKMSGVNLPSFQSNSSRFGIKPLFRTSNVGVGPTNICNASDEKEVRLKHQNIPTFVQDAPKKEIVAPVSKTPVRERQFVSNPIDNLNVDTWTNCNRPTTSSDHSKKRPASSPDFPASKNFKPDLSRPSTSTNEERSSLNDKDRQKSNDQPLSQCPLCATNFGKSVSLMERDAHIAKCLSAADDDVMW